ncbi:hypothetical protein H0H92_000691 [Tricholoma furcatifolium]|nr:hypothetical protein H0H92_000691 [Tricholoma furcatifolium]
MQNPKSATTFRALKTFELLSYCSKTSPFEYFQTLSRLTDNSGTQTIKDRYPAFLLSIRQWRYLRMMKRSGRGHDPNGSISQTKPGECTLLCPACPQPGINLPDGWEEAPRDKQHLYSLFLGIDANFRLKRKNVSSEKADPDLGGGFAYFVEDRAYKAYLEEHKNDIEPKSTCSRHDAVDLANSKPGVNYAATGIGTIECARHNMKRPCALGDLQVGKRYINMDYLFWKSLVGSHIKFIFVSYDIACQWSINLRDRLLQLDPSFLIFDGGSYLRFVVPKFHLPAHVESCQKWYSLNYTEGAGRTDGEAPERGWAEVNPLATSTKEMGPGSRRDTLDAHFSDYNWRKIVKMGPTLLRKTRAAVKDMIDYTIAHDELTASIPPESLKEWSKEIEVWEQQMWENARAKKTDTTRQNPYELKLELPTQAAVRRRMAENDAANIAAGKDLALDVDMPPSVLIAAGLDLEAEQRALKYESSQLWDHSQDRQKTKVQLRSNALTRKLTVWAERQLLYAPSVVILRRLDAAAEKERSTPRPVYDYPLWLPSSIQSKILFDLRLAEIEWDLHIAQADEALAGVRQQLQIRSYLFKFKDRNVRGQHANTRAWNAIKTIQHKIDTFANEYRAAQKAILALACLLGKVGIAHYPPLLDDDIRSFAEDEDRVGAGRIVTSWIWRSIGAAGIEGNDELFLDALRVEWLKSRARAAHFTEEVELLQEEMSRVQRFLAWQERVWLDRAEKASLLHPGPRQEGLAAYAHRQAALRSDLATLFSRMWLPLPHLIKDACNTISMAHLDPQVALSLKNSR